MFQFLALAALGQLLFESMVWLLVSRGRSQQFLRLQLIISPLTIAGFAIGLPFGIKGVALSGSLVMIGMFPWMLRFAFRDTPLTLSRFAKAIACPIALCLAGVLAAELALSFTRPQRTIPQLFAVAAGFAAVYFSAILIPAVRTEIGSFKDLIQELRRSRRTA